MDYKFFFMPILRLDNVSVRKGQTMALAQISWELNVGQNWAIIGGNGAGKSTFLSLVRGDIWPVQNVGLRHYFNADGTPSLSPIGFREHTTTVSAELIDHYLQLERVIDGKTLLMAGLHNTPLIYTPPTPQEWEEIHSLAERMGVTALLDKPLPECSTGQVKRLFLARAMASKPRLVFLDEYADGLDRESRLEIIALVDRIAKSGVQILCATHRATELPACINRILMLENGRIVHAGARTMNSLSDPQDTLIKQSDSLRDQDKHSVLDDPLVTTPEDIRQTAAMDFSLLPASKTVDSSVPVISMSNATAGIVRNANLVVQRGERWMLTGRNGAGKSTLLRMMTGELPAACGGEVRWFGQERIPADGAFKDFWAIKQRIGVVSPRLQTLHRVEITVLDVVLSGFWQHIGLHKYPTPIMEQTAFETLAALGISNLAERKANTLSYGQLRKVIIARALVNSPSLLILDEPFSGLDAPSRHDMRIILNGLAGQGLTMVLATHHPEESQCWATNNATITDGVVTILQD
ncbi:ATP-binding cassette domain-containing protein [Halodesulfovibrio aestuarii]|uniref:ATP-binding cassette domain-containing protein n=1 Tax=Halodesulfovibrio aestuarii TaxID=126333 RepID=UPI000424A503